MATELEKMGIDTDEREDELRVHGGDLEGSTVEGHEDHRIIMALAVAALVASGETTITGAEDVDVSFPSFFDVFEEIGVEITQT
jgi:3-phosphoshikimate 1-carboxyvinyltransferase